MRYKMYLYGLIIEMLYTLFGLQVILFTIGISINTGLVSAIFCIASMVVAFYNIKIHVFKK